MVLYEANFGYTIEKGALISCQGGNGDVQSYNIVKKKSSDSGIQYKSTPGELLTNYLIPEIGPELASLSPIIKLNDEALRRLDTMDPTSPVVASKKVFIIMLNKLIEEYVAVEKPLEKAKKLFMDYMISTNDQPYIVKKFVDDIYQESNTAERKKFCDESRRNPDCFSRMMTPNRAIQWWKQEISLPGFDTMSVKFRRSIIRILLHDKNQSNVERSFGSLQRKASPNRPRLDHKTILFEEITRTFKLQPEIFANLQYEKESIKFRNELALKISHKKK